MSDLDYDALQRLADAATPGPWEADDNQPFSRDLQGIFAPLSKRYVLKAEFDDQPENPADAEFIAASREAVPALLTRVRELEAESRQKEAELKDLLQVDLPSRIAERDAALSTIAKARELHQKREVEGVDGDCATESCEHEDSCPLKKFEVCGECWDRCDEADIYFSERGIAPVLWPCPTIRALGSVPSTGEGNE